MTKKSVLFLCTGNSCRSQMAEGLANHFLGDKWEAFSAGTDPAGYVHPKAITVMDELGLDLSQNRSKSTDEFRDARPSLVVTVCDDASETCPPWLGEGDVIHISFPDPAKAVGSDEEVLAIFRSVRDDIRTKVLSHLERYE
ncbi:MAG: arsenate reductase ArsC [Anaerolineae bacterium]|nr:arsenate reductase ArsC [Anaerolineae bacterium]